MTRNTIKISSFLSDYSAALSRAQSLDSKVNSDASKISANYAAVVELSIRQAVGATEITISKNTDGTWNTDDILMFLKGISFCKYLGTELLIFAMAEISSDGVSLSHFRTFQSCIRVSLCGT